MKNSFTTYQAINLLTAKSACFQRVSNSSQRLRQTKQELLQYFEQFARRKRLLYIFHGCQFYSYIGLFFTFYTFHILHILPHSHTFHTFYFTYIYCSISLTMPLIDRRKLGFLIFLTVVKGLIRILILSKLLLRDNITRCK